MKTTIAAHAAANIRLTTMATKAFNGATSLLCVSTAGREADSAESASAFLEKESAGRPFIPVSYTHLDVYKRQRRNHEPAWIWRLLN